MIIHVVEPGDSLYKIGQEYGVSPYRLAIDNGIEYNSTLVIGQTVVVQFPTVVHTVKQGESLYIIAKQYGVPVISLYQNNPQLNGRSTIMPGEQLVITYDQEKLGSFEVNGYGEPSISGGLLRKTLHYLTYVTPFTYGLTQSGSLVMLNDNHMIDIAKEYDTAPLMHLSTLTEKGNFDSAHASIVLNNQMIQDKLIDEIIENMNDKGYYGLDVDFEFINKQDAEKYAAFISNLRSRLNPLGYEVITALAPKISAMQRGTIYEGHLYKEIGIASNAVFVMTYEWGYTYGPPQAVSPLPNVRAVLDYAVSEIPREKIFMAYPIMATIGHCRLKKEIKHVLFLTMKQSNWQFNTALKFNMMKSHKHLISTITIKEVGNMSYGLKTPQYSGKIGSNSRIWTARCRILEYYATVSTGMDRTEQLISHKTYFGIKQNTNYSR